MQTSNELLNQRWLETKWQRRLKRFSYENMNNDLALGIGFIFWLGPRSDTLDGFIDFVLLPDAELSVFASSAISTAIFLKFEFNFCLRYFFNYDNLLFMRSSSSLSVVLFLKPFSISVVSFLNIIINFYFKIFKKFFKKSTHFSVSFSVSLAVSLPVSRPSSFSSVIDLGTFFWGYLNKTQNVKHELNKSKLNINQNYLGFKAFLHRFFLLLLLFLSGS